MSWNYRIVKYANGSGFGLHEVFYNAEGKEIKMTKNAAGFTGETPEDVRGGLLMAKADAHKRPIFEEPPQWCNRCQAAEERS